MFPDVPVIDRPGIVSAWDDLKFAAAIEKTGRKNLIMAGVTIDVVYGVVMPPARLRLQSGENTVARMKDHGITPINWTTVGAELQRNWSLPTGKDLGRVFHYKFRVQDHECARRRPSYFAYRSKRSTAPDLTATNPALT